MTKSEPRELNKLTALANVADIGYLARSYSALIRSTRTAAARNAMLVEAGAIPAVISHSDFIIS